ncbi:MAG: hypothetical protein Q8M23_04280, partial [Bacteroidales bacterium]|nr:hypothetical protein [Bacteroidales bacterium]
MLRIVLFFFIIILATPISGQQILISEDLRGDTMVPKFGMNRKNFGHFYSGFHGFAGSAESLADSLNYTTSWAFDCGYRYKRRFSQVLSAGIEWQIKRLSYSTRQWDKLHTSAATKVDKQKLVFLQTGLSFYQRFNYDKRRGDYVGRYFDVGVYGDWSFNIRHEYFYRNRAGAKVRIRESGLDFIQPF